MFGTVSGITTKVKSECYEKVCINAANLHGVCGRSRFRFDIMQRYTNRRN